MLKKTRQIVTVIIAVCLWLTQSAVSYAESEEGALAKYEEELDLLNNELGTNYVLSPTGTASYEDMVTFFTDMSLEEFDDYIRDAYDAEKEFDLVTSKETMMKDDTNLTRSTLQRQKYYYDGNANYLYIDAYTTTVSGSTIYTGDVSTAGCAISTYPAYMAKSHTAVFSSDMKTVNVSYTCVKYVSENVISGTTNVVSVTFGAGAGNVYPVV